MEATLPGMEAPEACQAEIFRLDSEETGSHRRFWGKRETFIGKVVLVTVRTLD